ncbi:TonB-dependent receptor [Citromicrobium sp. RCC1885]|uniref:TonB-dependent receptor n=1 Tax=unclassified Citromicrobium TaxID=2630544 RepID=UPI0006C91291|nr:MULTISPECIES: TonB-dependent receptor [unclassified Citromicrobium]KPM25389.1 TonB-dependent receptor [Citromicrobium sp. RCC1885]KPM28631.1 TonB-dependent receptor [Citromicrobium sp. RCC1878]OAM09825.1 TonB-dependent receptor [Citromicrobium sp. RCC1897]|tara:strand:+ start:11063 stop:13423 length:2361 start_codon:yes stop_codon:yes gene_type:complete
MRSAKSHALRAGLLAGTGFAAFIAAPAMAQDASAEDAMPYSEEASADPDLNVITVTARRREERLIDVPISVTSFSGEQLEQRGAVDITDIGNYTPNVTLEASRATNSTLSAFIRGIGQQDPVSGFEQGVGIYLDDVYLNRPQAAVLEIYDVERIEVLRGPQGTLYGRNTIGGAVKYVSRRLPQDFSLKAKASYGTYNLAEGVVTASAPLNDLIRVGGSVARLSRGGFGDNLTLGTENYNKDIWAGRASFEMGGYGEPVFLRIQGDYTKDKSNPRGGHRLIPGQVSGAPVLDDVFDTRGGLDDPKQEVESYGLSMQAEIDMGAGLTLRSISAWRKDDSSTPIDFDALPAVDLDVPGLYLNEQISQELQVLYDDGGPLTGLIGAYYLDATADTLFDVRIFTTLAGLTAYTQADVDTETFAIFGDFSYDLTDQLSLSVGGRYTWDNRQASILRQNYLGGGSPVFGGAGVPFGAPGTDFDGERDFKKFTPRASISFKPTPDHNIYASYSKGFKGGGFDPRGVGANAPDLNNDGVRSDDEITAFLSFAPEEVDSYEVGYKGSLLNGMINVAIAGFYADYKDVQIPGSVACTVAGLPSFCGVVSNAGKATFKGLEFEGSARLGAGFVLSGSLGYIDAQYDEYITNINNTPTDVADFREVQNTPKWTGSATLAYNAPVGTGDLYAGATVSYRSKTYQFEIPNPYLDQDGYALLSADIVYTLPGDRITIGVHGKNLLDKRYKTSGYTFVATNPTTGEIINGANGFPIPTLGPEGTLTAFYGNPREVFATIGFKF